MGLGMFRPFSWMVVELGGFLIMNRLGIVNSARRATKSKTVRRENMPIYDLNPSKKVLTSLNKSIHFSVKEIDSNQLYKERR